jgi:hypothetical protein
LDPRLGLRCLSGLRPQDIAGVVFPRLNLLTSG